MYIFLGHNVSHIMPDLADAIKASGNEALATAFVAATKDVQNLQGKPSNSELLEVRFKELVSL